eukprot:4811462-Ditylum_brightwellii.AAC.1
MDLKPAAVMDSVAGVGDGDMDLKPDVVMDSDAGVGDGEEGVKVSDDSSNGVTEFSYITPKL